MPSSGGSVSDAPVNKVVDGKSHYLAYITPDEGKSLVDQGGKEVVTDSGIPAYPPPTGTAAEARAYSGGSTSGSGPPGGGDPGMTYTAPPPTVDRHPEQPITPTVWTPGAGKPEVGPVEETKENILTRIKDGTMSKIEGWKIASKLGFLTNNAFVKSMGGAISLVTALGPEAQAKAMTWGLENRLKSIQKQKDFHPGAYGYKISDIQDDLEGIKDEHSLKICIQQNTEVVILMIH